MPPLTGVVFTTTGVPLPEVVAAWMDAAGLAWSAVSSEDALADLCLRANPRIAILDARADAEAAIRACRRLKADSYSAVVPAVLVANGDDERLAACFAAGADEVLREACGPAETRLRLATVLRRSDRDVQVHPSTRLPGTVAIEREITERIAAGSRFAVCYADLDHFKEYNDRYSYYEGDRVIRVLARILHDVVKGLCGASGFVGHIGGDDFIFIVPAEAVEPVCAEVIEVFDLLAPWQYSEADRRAGYFFGKDRRGELHRVPLMTVSIGVVTNERRLFTTPSQVSELATEMKSYAKTLPGSVFSVDRRHDALTAAGVVVDRRQQPLNTLDDR